MGKRKNSMFDYKRKLDELEEEIERIKDVYPDLYKKNRQALEEMRKKYEADKKKMDEDCKKYEKKMKNLGKLIENGSRNLISKDEKVEKK